MTDPFRDVLNDAPALRRVAAAWHAQPGRPATPVTRFAPSPTGELHLGHVAHALWVWGVARAVGARVLIRIEDHDRSRSTSDYELGILRDMEWLGFASDARSLSSLRDDVQSPFRQSDSGAEYQAAMERLPPGASPYGCTCTRGMLGDPGSDGERWYPGTCRGMPLHREKPTVWRVVIPDVPTAVEDLLHGPVVQHPQRDHGDVVIRDARGQWTYQFCVVVDDIRHGVDLIVRGVDLMPSTGRQHLLGTMLGRAVSPVMVHHPLILAPDGRKLSKRDRSETVASMRARGLSRDTVIGAALQASGLLDEPPQGMASRG